MASINDIYPEWTKMPAPIWADIFSRLPSADEKAAALSCTIFADLYRRTHAFETASKREALAGMQVDRPTPYHVLDKSRPIRPIRNLPTYMLRYNGSDAFELYEGNLDHIKMQFSVSEDQKICDFSARLHQRNKIQIVYFTGEEIRTASWSLENQDKKEDRCLSEVFVDAQCRLIDDYGVVVIMNKRLVSFDFEVGRAHTLPISYDKVIPHQSQPFLMVISSAFVKPLVMIWNYSTGEKFHLEPPSKSKLFSFIGGGGFFGSQALASWTLEKKRKKVTVMAYYDLAKNAGSALVKSCRNFVLKGKSYKDVKVVAEKYVLSQEENGATVCDRISDRKRLWSKQKGMMSLWPGNSPGNPLFMSEQNAFIFKVFNVETGEDQFGFQFCKPLYLIHSVDGPSLIVEDRKL